MRAGLQQPSSLHGGSVCLPWVQARGVNRKL
jgi:hypothetical protein